jgi:hypothetical protein
MKIESYDVPVPKVFKLTINKEEAKVLCTILRSYENSQANVVDEYDKFVSIYTCLEQSFRLGEDAR